MRRRRDQRRELDRARGLVRDQARGLEADRGAAWGVEQEVGVVVAEEQDLEAAQGLGLGRGLERGKVLDTAAAQERPGA